MASILRDVWTRIKKSFPSKGIVDGEDKNKEVIIVRDSEPSSIINSFEKVIRYFIFDELRSVLGERWLRQGVPKEIRTRWLERKSDDENAGRSPENNLISYADFSDYKEIILRNWANIFCKFFRDKEQTSVLYLK